MGERNIKKDGEKKIRQMDRDMERKRETEMKRQIHWVKEGCLVYLKASNHYQIETWPKPSNRGRSSRLSRGRSGLQWVPWHHSKGPGTSIVHGCCALSICYLCLALSLYLSMDSMPPFVKSNYFYNGLRALSLCWKDVLDEQLSKEPSCPSSVINESSLFRKVWLALDSCSTFTDRGTDRIAQSWDTFTGGMSNQGNRLFCIFSVFFSFWVAIIFFFAENQIWTRESCQRKALPVWAPFWPGFKYLSSLFAEYLCLYIRTHWCDFLITPDFNLLIKDRTQPGRSYCWRGQPGSTLGGGGF